MSKYQNVAESSGNNLSRVCFLLLIRRVDTGRVDCLCDFETLQLPIPSRNFEGLRGGPEVKNPAYRACAIFVRSRRRSRRTDQRRRAAALSVDTKPCDAAKWQGKPTFRAFFACIVSFRSDMVLDGSCVAEHVSGKPQVHCQKSQMESASQHRGQDVLHPLFTGSQDLRCQQTTVQTLGFLHWQPSCPYVALSLAFVASPYLNVVRVNLMARAD